MEHYKNREAALGQRVKVYFHLRKKKFSVVALEGPDKGRVVGHINDIRLEDCTFLVYEKRRQEVLRTRQKNVHAYIVGTFAGTDVKKGKQAFYNPYLYDSFVKENQKPLFSHPEVSLSEKKIYLN